jgi:DnaK suppressor protein
MTLDTDKFRKMIHHRRKELENLGANSAAGIETVELDQTKVGRLSRMDAIQIQQMGLASERRRNRELIALDAALRRIEHDEYGICNQCGDEISQGRLESDPSVPLCIQCASALEDR